MATAPPSRAFTMESHQKYMKEHVNPMLESLVTALLLKKPVNPVPFMMGWFSEQVPGGGGDAENEMSIEQLRQKIEEVKAQCRLLEEQKTTQVVKQKESKGSAQPESKDAEEEPAEDEEADEDEEDDDEDDVMDMEEFEKKRALAAKASGPRTSVSAEAYGVYNQKDENFKPPVYEKSPTEVQAIEKMLSSIFMFEGLSKENLTSVIGAMQLQVVEDGDTVIKQGDKVADHLFCIEQGHLECFKGETKVKEYNSGEAFGELALLYNTPRAATVIAQGGSCRLWKLDRETFNHIIKGAAEARIEKLQNFVKGCKSLSSMDTFEKLKLCEALKKEDFTKGQVILKEGDAGNCMYFIEKGTCIASKSGVDVYKHEEGDFFGELALLDKEPRKATVTAQTDATCFSVSASTFESLIGSFREILKRSYK
jgi:cAMP-dependent protein kinase regulator